MCQESQCRLRAFQGKKKRLKAGNIGFDHRWIGIYPIYTIISGQSGGIRDLYLNNYRFKRAQINTWESSDRNWCGYCHTGEYSMAQRAWVSLHCGQQRKYGEYTQCWVDLRIPFGIWSFILDKDQIITNLRTEYMRICSFLYSLIIWFLRLNTSWSNPVINEPGRRSDLYTNLINGQGVEYVSKDEKGVKSLNRLENFSWMGFI